MNDKTTQMVIAANVRRLLRESNWSQAELARQSDTSEIHISRVVRGQAMAGGGLIGRIAKSFGVSIDSLYTKSRKNSH